MTKFKAELTRTTEERDILKRPLCSFMSNLALFAAYIVRKDPPKHPSEVPVYERASQLVQTEQHVPSAKGASQRSLRLAQGAPVTLGSGERQVISTDPLLL